MNAIPDDEEVLIGAADIDFDGEGNTGNPAQIVDYRTNIHSIAAFPGGGTALMDWVTEQDFESLVPGDKPAYVEFLIGTDGKVSEVVLPEMVPESVRPEIKEKLLQMPAWRPGKDYSNREVRVRYLMPLFPNRYPK